MDSPVNRYAGPEGQEDMPFLLTPGPLTTSRTVKATMLADWGSRDIEFRKVVADIRKGLLGLAGCDASYECVIMQGSGTFAIEAALGCFCPAAETKTLVVANGAYGDRAAKILERIGRPLVKIDKGDSAAPTVDEVEARLEEDPAISHVWVIHCETTSGIVNPIQDMARAVKARGKVFMVDAMSSFGALPLDMMDGMDVMVSSSNKCIEGVPGFSYVLVKRNMLEASKGRCHSVVLDLYEQWKGLEANGQFRFTPPTHALVAFHQAMRHGHALIKDETLAIPETFALRDFFEIFQYAALEMEDILHADGLHECGCLFASDATGAEHRHLATLESRTILARPCGELRKAGRVGVERPPKRSERNFVIVARIDHYGFGVRDQGVPIRRSDIGANAVERIDTLDAHRHDLLLETHLHAVKGDLGSAAELDLKTAQRRYRLQIG